MEPSKHLSPSKESSIANLVGYPSPEFREAPPPLGQSGYFYIPMSPEEHRRLTGQSQFTDSLMQDQHTATSTPADEQGIEIPQTDAAPSVVADPSGRFDFTQDWTRQFRGNDRKFMQKHVLDYMAKNRPNRQPLRYLEIGVFEGRSGCHVLDHYPDLEYTGIDLWQTSGLSPIYYPSKDDTAIGEIEERARKNLAHFVAQQGSKVTIMKGQATRCVSELLEAGERFDWIYIDAAHFALNVVAEAAIAWQMLEVGGLMLFDDYKDRGARNTTLSGGEAFLGLVHHARLFQNHQLGVVKLSESQTQPLYRKQKLGNA